MTYLQDVQAIATRFGLLLNGGRLGSVIELCSGDADMSETNESFELALFKFWTRGEMLS